MSGFDPTAKLTTGGTIIVAPPSEQTPRRFGVGDVVAGIYQVERFLGEGGMGVVLAALHLPTRQRMALKVLQPDSESDDAAVARFWREARAISRLSHPNVVRIFDVGMLVDNTPYMAMELLQGESLADRMERDGRLPLNVALSIVRQAGDAIIAAHAIGVVHRDLKPENLFLARTESGAEVLKVLDFGISKAMRATVSDDQQKLTKTTDVFGSPTYMSPEQLKASRDVDERTDVWSLAVIFYEMLAATPPFFGRSIAEIFGAILYKSPDPLSKVRSDVPPRIEAALLRGLEKDRTQRSANMREFLGGLVSEATNTDVPATLVATTAPSPGRKGTPVIFIVGAFVLGSLVAFIAARLLAGP